MPAPIRVPKAAARRPKAAVRPAQAADSNYHAPLMEIPSVEEDSDLWTADENKLTSEWKARKKAWAIKYRRRREQQQQMTDEVIAQEVDPVIDSMIDLVADSMASEDDDASDAANSDADSDVYLDIFNEKSYKEFRTWGSKKKIKALILMRWKKRKRRLKNCVDLLNWTDFTLE